LSNRVLELRPGDDETPGQPPLVFEGTYEEFVDHRGGEAAGVHR
jgi:hypothetical protein